VPLLLGLGVTELSASGPTIPAVKQAVRETTHRHAEALAREALRLDSAAAVRALLAEAARDAAGDAA
jgi:phosphoenolpyruvate-protein kinase (PTS system EI component)